MSLKLYGISNCDTVKKARKALEAAGKEVTFVDVRKDGLEAATVQTWLDAVGIEKLLNKRGTTWRQMDDVGQAEVIHNTAKAIAAAPTLFKRPVIEAAGGQITVGWSKAEQEQYL